MLRVAGQSWIPDPTALLAREVPPRAFYMVRKSLPPEAAIAFLPSQSRQTLLEIPYSFSSVADVIIHS